MASKFKRKENIMPVSNKETLPVEEVLAAADTLTEEDAVIDLAADKRLPPPLLDASDIAEHAAKLSEALAGEPVSSSPEPIEILEETPRMQVIHAGDFDIISTAERIDVVNRLLGESSVPVAAPIPVRPNAQITDQILAEQEAGRAALARQQARAAYIKPTEKTQAEIDREVKNIEILRPHDLSHIQQRQLLNVAVPGKGEKY